MSLPRNVEGVGVVLRDVVRGGIVVVFREPRDGVLTEDEVCRLVLASESEEVFFVGGSVEYSSPRKDTCRLSVGGDLAVGVRFVGVVARSVLVLGMVESFRSFTDVVPSVVQIGAAVADDEDVRVVPGDIEDVHGSAQTAFEYDDDMVVLSSVLVEFLSGLGPVIVRERFNVVDDDLCIDAPIDLGVGEEEALRIDPSHGGVNARLRFSGIHSPPPPSPFI